MSDYVVTVTPTIMDGTVVRWFRSEAAVGASDLIVSASRNGVMGGGNYISPDVFNRAWAASCDIAAGRSVEHLATHRRRGIIGPLVAVVP